MPRPPSGAASLKAALIACLATAAAGLAADVPPRGPRRGREQPPGPRPGRKHLEDRRPGGNHPGDRCPDENHRGNAGASLTETILDAYQTRR